MAVGDRDADRGGRVGGGMRRERPARSRAVAVWARPMVVLAWLAEYRFGPGSRPKAPTRTPFRQDATPTLGPRHVKRRGVEGGRGPCMAGVRC